MLGWHRRQRRIAQDRVGARGGVQSDRRRDRHLTGGGQGCRRGVSAGSVATPRSRQARCVQTRAGSPVGLVSAALGAPGGQRRVRQLRGRTEWRTVQPRGLAWPVGRLPAPGVVSGDCRRAPGWSAVTSRVRRWSAVTSRVPATSTWSAWTGAEPVSMPVGIGGRLMPNCDRPCDSADISSLGRSVIIGGLDELAVLRRWFDALGQLGYGDYCGWTRDGQGGDCAHGCREPASTSVRHGSLLNIWTTSGRYSSTTSSVADGFMGGADSADVIDGTGVTVGSRSDDTEL